MKRKILRKTQSLCPVCLRRITANHVLDNNNVYLEKHCDDHGDFRTIIWRGEDQLSMELWRKDAAPISNAEEVSCAEECGLCGGHEQETCCILVEVTKRCNLHCSYCFAGNSSNADPSLETVKKWLKDLADSGLTFIHLSGGEPTLRDDLPEIVAYAKKCGFRFVQLNTNGLRLARDVAYVRALAEAGLSFVFLQFDGTTDKIYRVMRGESLYDMKRRAIENCDSRNLGVTLVSTVVPGVNDDNIGELISLAVSLSPSVRGVHFQPVSYFGRYPEQPDDDMRITLPELLEKIQSQTHGGVPVDCFSPSRCDHPMCGFHGDFVVMPDGLRPLSRQAASNDPVSQSTRFTAAEKSRRFVGRRWERPRSCCTCGSSDFESFDGFIERVGSHGFTITAMAFQDCFNIDIERLRRCSMHVYTDGKIIPFCAHYLTPGIS